MKVGELREMLEGVDADTPIITGYESSDEGEGYTVIDGVEEVTLENGLTVVNFLQQEVANEEDIDEDAVDFEE